MRGPWTIVSFLAVVNMIALAMFVGWLWQSGRLTRDRIDQIRELLAMTPAEAELEANAGADEADGVRAAPETSLPSEEQISQNERNDEQTRQKMSRVRADSDRRLSQIKVYADELDRAQTRFEEEQRAGEKSLRDLTRNSIDEQFLQTVKLYESQKPKTARIWMMNLYAEGRVDQVVAYLDAMDERAASRILAEFKTAPDAKVATELLERLRTFGLGAGGVEEASNANALGPT